MLHRTLTPDGDRCPHGRCGRATAPRRRKKPLIDVHLLTIYRPETFRQHFGALLAAVLIGALGRSGCLVAPDALAVLPNDAC
jgi:hypothetical protein